MQYASEVEKGWNFSTEILGANLAADMNSNYISKVEEAIKQLEENINNHEYRNLGVKQLQGYMLEEWAAGTFNVDAAAVESSDLAEVQHSLEKDSVDIALKSGRNISAKSYATAEQTAREQARLNIDTGKASYKGMDRLVPSDKLDAAKAHAHKQALRNAPIRKNVSKAYAETERKLTDTVQNAEGVSSKKVSRKDLDKIAEESKEKKFKAENHGVTADSSINTKYLVKQAMKAGYTAAAVTVVLQLAPEIIKAIDYLIKNGELDINQIARMEKKSISASAEGFLRGTVSSALLIMCEKGALGEAFKAINPMVLGTAVAIVMQTVKNSVLVAAGKMSPEQMGAAFVDTVVVSGGYLLGAHIGGIVGQAITFQIPCVGYLLGSLIGTLCCSVYHVGKKKLISFCVDTGFTCFGLVNQNYELPESVMNELGVETIAIPRTQIQHINVPRAQIQTVDVNTAQYETVKMTVLRRGVIGVNKVGYVLPETLR